MPFENEYSANGHCSSSLFSNEVVICCAESGRPSLQLDQVFLLQALPCQRVSHVLPDDLVHAFLGNLKYNWVTQQGRFQKTYHIPSWSQHACDCAIVERVSCNCTLEPLLPWDETVPDIRVPHQGPFHINQVLGSQWLSGDRAVHHLIRFGKLGLLSLWSHGGHPECWKVAFFAVTGSVADAVEVGLLSESVHPLRHDVLLSRLKPRPRLLLLPVGWVPELLLLRLQLLLVLLQLLVVLLLLVQDERDDSFLVKDPTVRCDNRVGGWLKG